MSGEEILLYFLLATVSFLYSSVGHGGASGYLAIMALFSFGTAEMRQTALLLNILVSLVAFIQFYSAGYFNFRIFLPLAATSVPAAFAGGLITIDTGIYNKVLGILLLFSVFKLSGITPHKQTQSRESSIVISLLIGIAIGFVSGLIGIGGGIILSPILLMLNWADMKETAAVSSLFILVNSVAGLAGTLVDGGTISSNLIWPVIFAIAGGVAGSYLGSRKLNNSFLKKILAIVLLIASVKLLSI
jgi:uncharacterized membrane protein YfcA